MKDAIELLSEKLTTWAEGFVLFLPNFIVAALVLAAIIGVSKLIEQLTKKMLLRFTHNIPIINFISSVVHYTIILLGFILALSILQLNQAVTSLLAGAGVVGLALGLAFQNPIKNTVSGFIMSYRRFYRVGDWVETNDFFGLIEDIGIRVSSLRLPTGELVVLPNDAIVNNSFKNYTIHGRRAIEIDIGISYGDDLEKVERVVHDTVVDKVERIESEDPEIYFKEYGNSSINFMLRFWINKVDQKSYLRIQSQAIKAIKQAFNENDITIPFPIRTLDFGIKGGEKLTQMLHPPAED
ncbi:MAG: mechanosensitive ion channel family protein [Bacteroidales bacterium]